MFREKHKPGQYFVRDIEIKSSPIHGLGIFATKDLPEHYCVEVAPTIEFGRLLLKNFMETFETRHILHDYVFYHKDGIVLVALGWASIYNHNHDPNAFWKYAKDGERMVMEVWTKKPIKAGEEIVTKYIPNSGMLWFDDGYVERRLAED